MDTTHVFTEYQHKIFLFIKKSVWDANTAEDLTQDVFLNFLPKAQAVRDVKNYLYRSAAHAVINYFKNLKRRKVKIVTNIEIDDGNNSKKECRCINYWAR